MLLGINYTRKIIFCNKRMRFPFRELFEDMFGNDRLYNLKKFLFYQIDYIIM